MVNRWKYGKGLTEQVGRASDRHSNDRRSRLSLAAALEVFELEHAVFIRKIYFIRQFVELTMILG